MPYRPWAAPSPRPTCTLTPTASSRPRAARRSRPSWPRIRRTAPAWTHGAQRQARAPCSTRCWTSRCRCACRWRRRRALALARTGRRHRRGVFRRRGLDRARRAGPRPDPRGAGRRGPDARARGSQLCAARRRGARGLRARHGRPVEVGGDNEKALVTWLTKRLGAPVSAPSLSALGYELVGGRLLPGGAGGGAFMYAPDGQRLTLYVTRARPRPDRLPVHAGRAGARVLLGRGSVRLRAVGRRQPGRTATVSLEVYRQLQG